MNEDHHCPSCGKPLPPDAPMGLCPACLIAVTADTGAEEDTAAARAFDPPTPQQLADKFPQLEMLELIGCGGMGAVYKARQKELDRLVAVKILPPGIGDDATFSERFTREARALAKLNHPNIVTLYEFGCTDGLYFFLMEYIDGVNLRQAMRAGRFTPEEALAIVPPVCEALQYAHDNAVVHRDIKPENLLLDRDGRVKIADFGVAKVMGSAAADGETADAPAFSATRGAGTPRYMAPEQSGDPANADHRVDIYAMGVVLYELLTGEAPQGEVIPPSKRVSVDVRIDEIVLRALESQPELRFGSAAELRTCVETLTVPPSPDREATPAPQAVGDLRGSDPEPDSDSRPAAPTSDDDVLRGGTQTEQNASPQGWAAAGLAGLGVLLGVVAFRDSPSPPAMLLAAIVVAALAGLLLAIPVRRSLPGKGALIGSTLTLGLYLLLLLVFVLRGGLVAPGEEVPLYADQPAEDSPAGSKVQRFVAEPGREQDTKWTVMDKPSPLNPDGWFVMAHLALGGTAQPHLPGEAKPTLLKLLKGDHESLSVEVTDQVRDSTMTFDLVRDRPTRMTINGKGYELLYPTTDVAAGQPDTKSLAMITVKPATTDAAAPGQPTAKRQRFDPKVDVEAKPLWSLYDKPSHLNSDGWAFYARMTLGGTAPLQFPGESERRAEVTLVEGDDDGIVLEIREVPADKHMKLSLVRDRPGEVTVNGAGYRVLYMGVYAGPDDADASPHAHVVITPAGQPRTAAAEDKQLEVVAETAVASDEVANGGAPINRFQYEDETMQGIVYRLRRETGIRVCFENLDFDAKTDGITLGEMLDELGAKESSGDISDKEAKRLAAVRRLRDEGTPEHYLCDVGERYEGIIETPTFGMLFKKLTDDTPYTWAKHGDTFVIRPRENSKLDFSVALIGDGMTLEQAAEKIIAQQPGDSTINLGPWVAMGPVAPGQAADPFPWMKSKLSKLDWQQVSATEALCRISELSEPGTVWELAGYNNSRGLTFQSEPRPIENKSR